MDIRREIVKDRRKMLKERLKLTMLLNIPTKFAIIASHFATEAVDAIPWGNNDPKEAPKELERLTHVDIYKLTEKHYVRRWTEERKQHNDRTCARMWRPNKRTRDKMEKGLSVDSLVDLYNTLYPDKWASKSKGKSSDGADRRREVLVPSLVTFVSRGDAAASGDGPATEIKYLGPGERDKQDSASFYQNLTDSFSCERVIAPCLENGVSGWYVNDPADEGNLMRRRFVGKFADGRLREGEYSHTMLIFAASVCSGNGPQAKAGIGIVTKDTVHYHDARARERLMQAEHEANLSDLKEQHLQSLKLCLRALTNPNRGHDRHIYPAGLHEPFDMAKVCPLLGGAFGFLLERLGAPHDPVKLGYVGSRSRPEWKSSSEDKINEDAWEKYDQLEDADDDLKQKLLEQLGIHRQPRKDNESSQQLSEMLETITTQPHLAFVDRDRLLNLVGAEDSASQQDNTDDPAQSQAQPMPSSSASLPRNPTTILIPKAAPEPKPKAEETAKPKGEAGKPAKPRKEPSKPVTPNRAAARALLAAAQLIPYNIAHCTRLIIASNSDYAVEMATTRLGPALERGRPLRSAKNRTIEDEDIWWEFAGAVKDLAYQGVEVAVCKCADHEGLYMKGVAEDAWHPSGSIKKENWVVGMPQALRAAERAMITKTRKEEFVRWTAYFV
ncbi:hypothetical protein C8A03DRAFT_37030 [Achaetomium macrosporum]|uniref:Uncharacterized protein n=1 Tax=Achaetomium macrosporum TaxID=79813 RepID=A0AAN7C660_9PEZI|nr:hypothetical protein C8A03DRAFT_37030 [Achaetomium macrosporum]